MKTQGKRIYFEDMENFWLEKGEYALHKDGTWYACAPDGRLANLANHQVIEHEDGTITVKPSILVGDHRGNWHGFLEKGVWRQV